MTQSPFVQEQIRLNSRQRYTPDAGGLALGRFEQLQDPSFGFQQFREMAARSAPGMGTMSQLSLATGGSRRGAMEQAQGLGVQARQQAYDAFGQYRQGMQGLANQSLGMHFANQQFGLAQREATRQARANRWVGFANNMIEMGSSFLPGPGGSR